MPKTYTFVLFEEDAAVFHGNLQYDKDNLLERQSELDESNTTDALEMESNTQSMRVVDILISQYQQQEAFGPVVEMSINQAQAETLHLALVQQAAFAKRQSLSMSKLLANPSLPREERDLLYLEYKSYVAQFLVVDSLLTQVGRHL